jgi:hypothetical protein
VLFSLVHVTSKLGEAEYGQLLHWEYCARRHWIIAQKEDYYVVLSAWYNIDKYSDAEELQAIAALLGIKTLSQSFSGQIILTTVSSSTKILSFLVCSFRRNYDLDAQICHVQN